MNMTIEKTLVLLFAVLFPLAAAAQKVRKEDMERAAYIQASKEYYCGTGHGSTLDAASRMALAELQASIWQVVGSTGTMTIENADSGGVVSSKIKTDIGIETSTAGVLTDTKQLTMQYGNHNQEWIVLRYVEREKVGQMFKQREEHIQDYYYTACKSETEGRIADALQHYYWAYCLLRSLPTADELHVRDDQYQKQYLAEYIPKQMEDIFKNLKVEAGTQDAGHLNLVATYKGRNVTSLDIRYSTDGGGKWSKIVNVTDGIAQIELPGDGSTAGLQVSYEYRNEERSRHGGPVLQMMMNRNGSTDAFTGSRATVDFGNKKHQKAVQKVFQAAVEEMSEATNAVAVADDRDLRHAVQRVMDAIRSRKYDEAADLFTPEGYNMYQDLIAFGQAHLPKEADAKKVNFYDGADGRKVCRSIPMKFVFSNNHIIINEEVTLTFNTENKIESLAFAIDKSVRESIFNSKGQWSSQVRMAIATFLENYKTAFALKRLDYIKGIFDDCAVIVTGTVTTRATGRKGDQTMRLKEDVKYNTYNKEQYMERLEQQFKKTQFINLRFTDVGVDQIGNYEDFAMRIRQDYFSSGYADTGYLFLMVDMNDPSNPIIKLRTWQPERDPSINGNLPKSSPFYGLICERNFR